MHVSVGQIDRVIITDESTDGNDKWQVIMRYNDIISINDPDSIITPPHDVLCKSYRQVD